MLPKPLRLNLKKDFKWVVQGKAIETKFAKLYLRVGQNEFPRLGIATSSKYFKQAVERNRARRILSAAFESLMKDIRPATINIVALPKTGILDVKSGDVLLDIQSRLKEYKILNETDDS